MGRLVGVLALFYVALAVGEHALEDPTCTQEEVPMEDKEGVAKFRELQKQGLTYDAGMFEVMEGELGALRSGAEVAERIVFKVAIHTCRVKLMPGVREWVSTEAGTYDVPIEVAPYSQPSNFNFIAGSRLLAHVMVKDSATVSDIHNFLESHGVHKRGRTAAVPGGEEAPVGVEL